MYLLQVHVLHVLTYSDSGNPHQSIKEYRSTIKYSLFRFKLQNLDSNLKRLEEAYHRLVRESFVLFSLTRYFRPSFTHTEVLMAFVGLRGFSDALILK